MKLSTYSLMIKTHNTHPYSYLCVNTFGSRVDTYLGSGPQWLDHLNDHGDDITTKVIYQVIVETQDDIDEFNSQCLRVSHLLDVVDDMSFANQRHEAGFGPGCTGFKWSEESKARVTGRNSASFKPVDIYDANSHLMLHTGVCIAEFCRDNPQYKQAGIWNTVSGQRGSTYGIYAMTPEKSEVYNTPTKRWHRINDTFSDHGKGSGKARLVNIYFAETGILCSANINISRFCRLTFEHYGADQSALTKTANGRQSQHKGLYAVYQRDPFFT